LEILRELGAENKDVKIVSFSRNFGQQSALLAGFERASGDAIINIDADLQDPPQAILQMIEKFNEGYDIVIGRRKNRKGETFIKKFFSNMYQFLLSKIIKNKIPTDAGDFRLISRRVKEQIIKMQEHNRYLRGMTAFVGFKQTTVEFEREERKEGKTKYNFKKLTKLGIDGIVANSDVPLMLNFKISFGLVALGKLIVLIYLILLICKVAVTLTAWLIPILLVLVGIIVFSVGIVGIYVGRTFTEVQNRPKYIVSEEINFNEMAKFDE
jgi:dolichol-phosphate mannosyltransferase